MVTVESEQHWRSGAASTSGRLVLLWQPLQNAIVTVESGTVGSLVAGRYAIQSELARGGMGAVFRVVDRSTGSVVALKRSLAEGLGTAERNAALLEARVTEALQAFSADDEDTETFGIDFIPEASARSVGESSVFRLMPLVVTRDADWEAVGAAAVFECAKPHRLTAQLMRELALALRANAVTTVVEPKLRGAAAPV